jgi:hypothetical protein
MKIDDNAMRTTRSMKALGELTSRNMVTEYELLDKAIKLVYKSAEHDDIPTTIMRFAHAERSASYLRDIAIKKWNLDLLSFDEAMKMHHMTSEIIFGDLLIELSTLLERNIRANDLKKLTLLIDASNALALSLSDDVNDYPDMEAYCMVSDKVKAVQDAIEQAKKGL